MMFSIASTRVMLRCVSAPRLAHRAVLLVRPTHRVVLPQSVSLPQSVCLFSSTTSDASDAATNTNETAETTTTAEETTLPNEEQETPPQTELTLEQQLQQQVAELKDQLLRSLAEQENTRRIARHDVLAAKDFAIKTFARALLETSDNLERALESVSEEEASSNPKLETLRLGVKMTRDGLMKALESNGVVPFGAVNDTFDPNLHAALFEYPDAEKEPGTIGQVLKAGFMLNKRVLRPAEVGVVKKAA
jgi:molecular chaperone GrpE